MIGDIEGITAAGMPVFVKLGGGALGLMRRPKLKTLSRLREAGATHLVTLLADADAAQLGNAAKAVGLEWLWVPLFNGDPPPPDRDSDMRANIEGIARSITNGGHVVLHCSAGIHRTGMVAYAILRELGQSPDQARTTLQRLSPVTADHVGEARLAWGDRLLGGVKA